MAESTKPLKLAFLSPYSKTGTIRGGADRHTHNLIDSLAKNPDLEIHIFSVGNERECNTKLRDNQFIHSIKLLKAPMTIAGVGVYPRQLAKSVQDINPDIVHAQMIGAPYGQAASILAKKYPTIVTVHTMTYQILNKNRTWKGKVHDSIWYRLEKKQAKVIFEFIAVSTNLKKELEKMGAKRVKVIPNGVEKKWFEMNDNPVPNRILCVGRFQKIKGQDVLLKAFSEVKKQVPGATLHLVGAVFEGDRYLKDLQKYAKEHNISDNVKFCIDIDDNQLMKEYGECQLFVLPSREESHPIVLLEAMAAGKPIIASGVGGVPDMVEDGQSGFLVEYEDHSGMSEAIIKLLSDDKLLERFSREGRKKVSHLNWDSIAETTLKEYHETIRLFGEKR